MSEQKKYRVWEPFLIGISAAIGLIAGYNIDFSHKEEAWFKIEDFSVPNGGDGRIEEILRFIETNYVDSLNVDELTLNVIDEAMKNLDPHSSYISPNEYNSHKEKMKGSYQGIGVETHNFKDSFYITKIFPDSPAKEAGLQIGDLLIAVNDTLVSGQGLEYVRINELLRDSTIAEVTLTVRSIQQSEPKSLDVPIRDIDLPTASDRYWIEEDILYLKVDRFSANTYEQFIESIDGLVDPQKPFDLILDLRSNPGGYLPEAIKILSQIFEEKDQILTYTEGLNRQKSEYRTTGKRFYRIDKVAVLIDKYSASGSEIIAGAIQDWDRGLVIGQQSYGKGLVQEIFPLRNGGALRLTVAKYYTPSGRSIQKNYENNTNQFLASKDTLETKLLKRRMRSGVGIVPDVTIDNAYVDCSFNPFIYYKYILKKISNQNSLDIKRNEFSYPLFLSFITDELSYEDPVLNPLCQSAVEKELYLTYKSMILDQKSYLKFKNLSDDNIAEALKFLNDNRETLALLSKEE